MGPSDDELMCRYRDGDAQAFEALFHRHSRSVYNFGRALLYGDGSAAEEILQETFLSVARSAQTYEPRGYFRTWLMRIARNHCLNRIESQQLRRSLEQPQSPQAVEVPWPQPSPPLSAESAEQVTRLQQALALLPERQREAIALFAFEDLSYREIAQVLDVPTNTVKTLIHRARAALAQALEEDDQENRHGL